MLNFGLPLARSAIAVAATVVAFGAFDKADAQMLKTVKDRGNLICGVSTGLPGFSNADDKGVWSGLDVDLCRAVAAAVFNDSTKVKYVPLNAEQRFKALQSGEIDVLARTTTWSLGRDIGQGVTFTAINYYAARASSSARSSA